MDQNMAICRNIILILGVLSWIYSLPALADFKKIKNINITTLDFLFLKFDNFFIKNQHKILDRNPLTVRYQGINYDVNYEKEKEIKVTIYAVMDKTRYKRKKYLPKLVDCNIVRNRIFYNKFGYSGFLRKKTYSLDEDLMREILKNTIYNLQGLNEELKDFLIDKTKISIEIIHPIQSRNLSCSGNISDFELR